MKNIAYILSIFVILAVVSVMTYSHVNDLYKTNVFNDEKQIYTAAVEANDAEKINQFMRDYPGSQWSREAVYYRDKIIISDARESNDIPAITLFLKNNPHSSWYRYGIYYRDQMAYAQAKNINTIASYTSFLENHTGSDWQVHAENSVKRLNKGLIKSKSKKTINKKIAKVNVSSSDDVQMVPVPVPELSVKAEPQSKLTTSERLNKAVAIYDSIREDKERQAKIKAKKVEKIKSKKRACNRLKDQISRYDEHVSWYDLDGNGDRRYLNNQEVESKKQKYIEKYQRKCVK